MALNTGDAGPAINVPDITGTLTLTNTLIADNTDLTMAGRNCVATDLSDGGGNLEDGASCGFGASSLSNASAGLDPGGLADNGGPTETIALTQSSDALDQPLAAAGCPASDQRDEVRPQDGDADGQAVCDSGALEVEDTTPPDTKIDSGPAEGSTIATDEATFEFSGDPAADTAEIECSVDGEAFFVCTSPHSFSGLADGEHTVAFRAEDAVGNTDPTPVERSFTVDRPAPPAPPEPAAPQCAGEDATIVGTPDADEVVGTPGRDVISSRGGDDTVRGLGGEDLICADHGEDVVSGGADDDRILGGRAGDRLRGNGGSDELRGRRGDDDVAGGPSPDRLHGGPDTDRCRGGASDRFTACEQL
jgi:hypothetical protein